MMKTKLKKKIKKDEKESKPTPQIDMDFDGDLMELQRQMSKLSTDIKEYTNYKKAFKVSLVRGFGMAIGASLIAAALVYILDKMIKFMEYIPILTPIIEYLQKVAETL